MCAAYYSPPLDSWVKPARFCEVGERLSQRRRSRYPRTDSSKYSPSKGAGSCKQMAADSRARFDEGRATREDDGGVAAHPARYETSARREQQERDRAMVVNTRLVNRVITVGRVKNPTLPCCMEQEERGKHPLLAHPTYDASSQERCVLLFLVSLVSRSSSGCSCRACPL